MLKESKTNEDFEYQRLSQDEQKARGILGRLAGICADFIKPTRNGRKYSEKLWENVFNDPIMKEKIANKCCFGELGHPADRTETDMQKIAICLAEQPVKGSDGKLRAVFDILDTPNGRILKSLCDYGCNIGISSRGEGDLITDYNGDESVDPDTYQCECFDAVLIPAVKEARMNYVTESLNRTRYNKTLRASLQESLNNASEEDKKVMQETLNNLNIKLDEAENLDEMAMPRLVIDVIDQNNGEVKAVIKGGATSAMDYLVTHKTDSNLAVEITRYEDRIPMDTKLLFKKVDDVSEITQAGTNVHVYINSYLDRVRFASRGQDNSAAISAFNNGDCVVLYYPATPSANPPKSFAGTKGNKKPINSSLETTNEALNEEEYIETNIDFDNIVDDLTNYYSHGWPLDMAKKSLELNKEFGIINEEEFKEILANLEAENSQEEIEEPDDSTSEKSLDIDSIEAEDTDTVVNNEALVNELQESLKQKQELEQKLIELQEKLSVCYAKEAKNEEESDKYKHTVQKLAEDSKRANAYQARASLLEKKLKEAKEKEETLKSQLSEAKERVKVTAEKNVALKESVSKKGTETVKLNESISALNNELKSVKEAAEAEKAKLKETYNKKYAEKVKALKESVESEKAELTKQISELNENLNSQKTEYSQKLDKSQTLVEKYKKTAKIAVNKYIESQAVRLGSSVNEIKNRLPESYTFKDIDKVVDDLQEYNLNMSRLPFSTLTRTSVNENIKIKGTSSKNESILPANGFDDDIDEDLMYLAGK